MALAQALLFILPCKHVCNSPWHTAAEKDYTLPNATRHHL